jgi:hypothetical protein
MRLPDGRHTPVYVDQSRGGAGFWDSAGKWILLSSLLNNSQHSYQPYYGGATAGGLGSDGRGASHRSAGGGGGGAGALAIVGLVILGLLVAGGFYIYRMSKASRPGQGASYMAAMGHSPPAPAAAVAPQGALGPWLALQPGSFVTLSDAQAIEDSQKRGAGVRGIDYTVEQVGVAKDGEGFATWVLAHLNDGHQRLLMMIKGDESHVEHRVYFASEDFHPARRDNVLSRGDQWLFEAPQNPSQVDPARLRYAAEIPYSIDGAQLVYVRKDQGERHCDYVEKPALTGLGAQVATVVEYSTSDPTDNPELLILEIATAKNRMGEVALYLGSPIRASEVDIVKAAATA